MRHVIRIYDLDPFPGETMEEVIDECNPLQPGNGASCGQGSSGATGLGCGMQGKLEPKEIMRLERAPNCTDTCMPLCFPLFTCFEKGQLMKIIDSSDETLIGYVK